MPEFTKGNEMELTLQPWSYESYYRYTVEPRYNEGLGTMKITLLYQVSHYIRVKNLAQSWFSLATQRSPKLQVLVIRKLAAYFSLLISVRGRCLNSRHRNCHR